ncbi:MAG: TolC family protein [Prevotella sp.]|nr:TolC family protein [Prevotella sp.]
MKRRLTTIACAMLLPAAVMQAQGQWDLKRCIDHAISHNISIKQRDNLIKQSELQLSTAKNSRLPDLNASVGENLSFGRGLTAENTYTNTNTSNTSFGVSTSIPLFTGMRIENTIKLGQLNLDATTADLEKAKNDIAMQVAQQYIQIVYSKELVAVAHRQTGIDSMQVERLKEMLNHGKASKAEVSQQMAALAQSQLTVTQAENEYRMALLNLSQLLELPSPEGFAIADVDVSAFSTGVLPSADAIYSDALGIKPEIAAESLRLQGTERSIKIAEAARYPQLYLSGGLGTNYYTTSGFDADGFGRQLKNNFSQSIGLNLSIPLFNRFATRNSIRSAEIDRDNQRLQLDNAKKALYKEIQQVYYNAVSADAKYQSSIAAAQSSEDAFELMQAKYENGKATITEFNESKNNLMKAQSDLMQAKYEYLYQTALIEFYRGKPMKF